MNDIVGLAFAERLSQHNKGQAFGTMSHVVTITDRGSFNLLFTFPLDGMDITRIGENTYFSIQMAAEGAGVQLTANGFLGQDPKYKAGAKKAKITYAGTYKGKSVKYMTVDMKVDLAAMALRMSVKGTYQGVSVDGIASSVGQMVLADNNLALAQSTFSGDGVMGMSLYEGLVPIVSGITSMSFAGTVKSSGKQDSETGTYPKTSVGVVGAGN